MSRRAGSIAATTPRGSSGSTGWRSAHGCTILATNDVHYHAPERRPLQDVVTCIREKVTIATAGYLLNPNAERHLKSPARDGAAVRALAARDFGDARVRRCAALQPRRAALRISARDGARRPHAAAASRASDLGGRARALGRSASPYKVLTQLNHELPLIEKLDFARYFLTVHDIVAFARSLDPPILCQGRGSAANSAVCYCLGITAVDPATSDLLFERFISEERKEPPDIDVDFEHERREEVIQHIYAKYGRDRAGIAATVIHYRPRSAIREVGKVMGLSEDVCGALASTIWGHMDAELEDARADDAGLDLSDPHLKRTVKLAEQLVGMPRHLSQHVGGFILTERPLTETVPIGNGAMDDRTFIEWDKDDIEELGILKIDVLALGMLTCIRKCFDLIEQHHGERWELATVPQEVPQVYDMLCRGDSLGVFQVESRAQMNMLPRLKPRCFYDLVIEVAIVRPGPIQGDMVHPYLKRRSGKEPVTFPCPDPDARPARRARADPRADARRADLPGAGDEDRARCGEVQLRGSEPAAQGDGDLPLEGEYRDAAGEDGRADGGARLRSRFRPALLRPDQGLRRIWLPRKPRGELRASGLRVELAAVEVSGGVRLRAAQFAADGLLRARADRPRRARAWRRGARGGCEFERVGLHARTPLPLAGGEEARSAEGRACPH